MKFKPTHIKVSTTNPADGPDIAIGQSGITAEEPITVGELMKRTVTKIPNKVALRYKTGDTWNHVTYQQYYDLCIAAAKSFVKVIYFSTLFTCSCSSNQDTSTSFKPRDIFFRLKGSIHSQIVTHFLYLHVPGSVVPSRNFFCVDFVLTHLVYKPSSLQYFTPSWYSSESSPS